MGLIRRPTQRSTHDSPARSTTRARSSSSYRGSKASHLRRHGWPGRMAYEWVRLLIALALLKTTAEAKGVNWSIVLRADGQPDGSQDRRNLLQLSRHAMTAGRSARQDRTDHLPQRRSGLGLASASSTSSRRSPTSRPRVRQHAGSSSRVLSPAEPRPRRHAVPVRRGWLARLSHALPLVEPVQPPRPLRRSAESDRLSTPPH